MDAVMQSERALGHHPVDVSHENRGYDIESRSGKDDSLRFLEVKARHPSAETIFLTRNELICALNNPDQWTLVYVPVDQGKAATPIYSQGTFKDDIPFEASNFKIRIENLSKK